MKALFISILKGFLWIAITASLFLLSLSVLLYGIESSDILRKTFDMPQLPYVSKLHRFVSDKDLVYRGRPLGTIQTKMNAQYRKHPLFQDNLDIVPLNWNFNKSGYRRSSSDSPASVAIIGDSFVEAGDNDSDTLSEHLSRELGLPVSNFGLSGWGPYQYLQVLKTEVLPANPNIVIMSFFSGNDIEDIAAYNEWTKTGVYYDYGMAHPQFFERYKSFVSDIWSYINKHTLHALRVKVAKLRGRYSNSHTDKRHIQVQLPNNTFPDLFYYTTERNSDRYQDEWKQLRAILREAKTMTEKQGTKFFLTFIPKKLDIYKKYINEEESGPYWRSIIKTEKTLGSERDTKITQLCKEENISLINLTHPLAELAASGEKPYYQIDTHWNSRGRGTSVAYIKKHIKSLDLTKHTHD